MARRSPVVFRSESVHRWYFWGIFGRANVFRFFGMFLYVASVQLRGSVGVSEAFLFRIVTIRSEYRFRAFLRAPRSARLSINIAEG